MDSTDLPTGYDPKDHYPDEYLQFTPPSPIKTTYTNNLNSSLSIPDLVLQPIPLPIIRQNAFTES